MMRKLIVLFVILSSSFVLSQEVGLRTIPGSFSRLGFGARGIGMGNAMSAVTVGSNTAYYNPALAVQQDGNNIQTGYSFMSLDRTMNFLSFTKKFVFGRKDSTRNKKQAFAGLSLGLINSGVSGIDGRDNQGIKTGELQTSENLFFIGLANQFSSKLSLGITIRFYYYQLYEAITSTSIGLDAGVLYKYSGSLTFSAGINDINSQYDWDTGDLYGQSGIKSTDKFPIAKYFGSSYYFDSFNLLLAAEFKSYDNTRNYLKLGAEYKMRDELYFRGGIDQFNLSNSEVPFRPSLGFSYFYYSENWLIGIDYAIVFEPYSTSNIHILGLNLKL